ncbi:hypothetical protein LINPERHAP1_LOCUS20115 [Linum perenne]
MGAWSQEGCAAGELSSIWLRSIYFITKKNQFTSMLWKFTISVSLWNGIGRSQLDILTGKTIMLQTSWLKLGLNSVPTDFIS